MEIGIVIIISVLASLAASRVVMRVWPSRGKWGINREPVTNCPRCGKPLPKVRMPRNRRQALWGGSTCSDCGCEMDKYGTSINHH